MTLIAKPILLFSEYTAKVPETAIGEGCAMMQDQQIVDLRWERIEIVPELPLRHDPYYAILALPQLLA